MKIVDRLVGPCLIYAEDYVQAANKVCQCAKVSHKSDMPGDFSQVENFIRQRILDGHNSILEHCNMTFWTDATRGATHELVRHRHFSVTELSTRYCAFKDISFLVPYDKYYAAYNAVVEHLEEVSNFYEIFLKPIAANDVAREILPQCTVTEIYITANVRALRHFFKLRCAENAHWCIRGIALKMLDICKKVYPAFFDDIDLNRLDKLE